MSKKNSGSSSGNKTSGNKTGGNNGGNKTSGNKTGGNKTGGNNGGNKTSGNKTNGNNNSTKNSNKQQGVTSPNTGKKYDVGDTVKGKSGKEYTVQANGTMTSGGKTYAFNSDGKIAPVQTSSKSNNSTPALTSPKTGRTYNAGDTLKSSSGREYKVQADGTMTYNGSKYILTPTGNIVKQGTTNITNNSSSSGKGNGSNTTSNTKPSGTNYNYTNKDIQTLQDLGATSATDAYKKAIAQGYSKQEANKLAGTFGRLNSAASADASTQYQYGATQQDINEFNIMHGTNVSNSSISTGTYVFNTNNYKNVQQDLHTSADQANKIYDNIGRAMDNTDKNSEEYKYLQQMQDRMHDVNQSTLFVSNRLEDAYKATKAADEKVQRVVMNMTTDNLHITIGGKTGYSLQQGVNVKDGDSAKWQHYANTGIIGNKPNNSTVKSMQDVMNEKGTNINTVADILTAYQTKTKEDIKTDINTCATKSDLAVFARNNDNGLETVAAYMANQKKSPEEWQAFLDVFYTTNKNGEKKTPVVTEDIRKQWVEYYANVQKANETGVNVNVNTEAFAASDIYNVNGQWSFADSISGTWYGGKDKSNALINGGNATKAQADEAKAYIEKVSAETGVPAELLVATWISETGCDFNAAKSHGCMGTTYFYGNNPNCATAVDLRNKTNNLLNSMGETSSQGNYKYDIAFAAYNYLHNYESAADVGKNGNKWYSALSMYAVGNSESIVNGTNVYSSNKRVDVIRDIYGAAGVDRVFGEGTYKRIYG